jgi:tagatose 1,6-diphosphate aldolase
MLALMPQYSVRRLRDLGGDAIKILLSYTPLEDAAANDDKQVLIERIGDECAALQMPFFLEPVVYDPAGADVKSFEFLTTKPELVVRTVEEFSKARYNVDVLKIEFPVHAALVEGSSVYAGRRGYSMDEALNWFREVDRAAQIPYIFLSAGISGVEFVASLELAIAAQARFSGVLCGRANWQDGVPVFANNGRAAFEEWLRFSGSNNIRAVNECLRHATAWYDVKR